MNKVWSVVNAGDSANRKPYAVEGCHVGPREAAVIATEDAIVVGAHKDRGINGVARRDVEIGDEATCQLPSGDEGPGGAAVSGAV